MSICVNHPEREALSICFGCKKEFCKSCLDEGKEYYYCKNDDCQKLLKNELGIINIPEIIECPNCKTELELSLYEREKGTMHCPECESFIDFTSGIAEVIEDENYQEIMTLLNQGDVGIIKSILEDGNVDYIKMVSGKNIFEKSATEAIENSFPIEIEKTLFDFPKKFKVKIAYILK